MVFRLADLPNYTEFTALFDRYMITKVKAQLLPRGNVSEVSQQTGVAQNTISNIWSAIDYDDATAPANLATILQYGNNRHRRTTQTLTNVLAPKILSETYNNGITTAYSPSSKSKWVDCDNPNVQHFGVKVWLDAPPTPLTGTYSGQINCVYDLKVDYYVAFKYAV